MSAKNTRELFASYLRTGYFPEPHEDSIIAMMEEFLPEIDRAIAFCRRDERMTLFREWEIPTRREALIAIVHRLLGVQGWVRSKDEQIHFWVLCKESDMAAELRRKRDPYQVFADRLEDLRTAM